MQYSSTLRNNQVSQIQTTIDTSGTLRIYSGALPANCAADEPSGLLATISLPPTFLTSTNGVTTLNGSWTTTASGTGTAACFRMYDGSNACHIQGNTTTDLILNNSTITGGQTVTVTSFSITAGNA